MVQTPGYLRAGAAFDSTRRLGQGKSTSLHSEGYTKRISKHDVHSLALQGGPWDTTIIICWTATDKFPDGKPYNNHGVHIIKMAWFKVYEIDANEDSQVVERMMKAQAEAGVKEAAMPPITS